MRSRFAAPLAGTLLFSLSCGSATKATPAAPEVPAPEPSAAAETPAPPPVVETDLASVGLDAAALDRNADPCEDFYQFACGGWMASTEIPPDKSRWGRSFLEINERNLNDLHAILDKAAREPGDDPLDHKIGDFYAACMDEKTVDAAGKKGIAPLLAVVAKVKDVRSLAAAVTELHRNGIYPVFSLSAEQDFADARQMIAVIDQDGLGLPDRDLYLADDARSHDVRAAYTAHVERMLRLAGLDARAAKRGAGDVMTVETALAKLAKPRVERRNPKGMYNRIDRAGVAHSAPHFPWDAYYAALDIPSIEAISVTSVPYLEGIDHLLGGIKPAVWRSYLTWQVLDATADTLPKSFVDEDFSMASVLTGQKEQPPRWKRCVNMTHGALPQLVAQRYVQLRFSPAAKQATEQMVHAISDAFARELDRLDWMDPTTKQRARAKLQAMSYSIGYPDKWRAYDVDIARDALAADALALSALEVQRRLGKIGKPVDPDDWAFSPAVVNAGYNPLKNQMIFPAGILQPPFFDDKAAAAVNLGAIGMVVGHELTHGFDDQGGQFDADGNLHNWWESETGEKFHERTQCMADQYSQYEVLPGAKINGRLTLGENIADNGGLKIAFSAYRALRAGAHERLMADGFSEDQLFFLAYGQAWCSKTREAQARMLLQADVHSPERFRVLGTLSNSSEFAEAFSCPVGSPMHPANTCDIW